MVNKELLNIILIVLVSILSALLFIQGRDNSRFAYIRNDQVFDKFEGKKDLERILNLNINKQNNLLDSLKQEIDLLTLRNKSESLIYAKRQLLRKFEEEFMDNNEKDRTNYIQQTWNQINEYIKEYGVQRKYDYIFGATGNGSLMYANEAKDITEDIISYINNRHNDK